MAEVNIVPAVTETKVVEVEAEKIVLTLTRFEAEVLRALTGRGRVNGRFHSVFKALNDAGIKSGDLQVRADVGTRGTVTNLRVEEESILW